MVRGVGLLVVTAAFLTGVPACGDDAVPAAADGGQVDGPAPDADGDGGECQGAGPYVEDVSSCAALATDYQPRVSGSQGDAWPACISDDNIFHPINPSIASMARVAAFEEIAAQLWADDRLPSATDFVDARVIYAQDQGIDSRVQRRHDVHYPEPSRGATCADPGVPEQYPDRCVGPAKLLPILNDAFQRGVAEDQPRVQAARIEAALLWFFYVSVLSEVQSCTTKPQDCDSCWAYFSGGTPRESPLGLGRYLAAQGQETYDRGYDGTLAVRCWRNLDNETGTAVDLVLRDQAQAQLDRALLRGVALILRQRFADLACRGGDVRAARLAFVSTLGPFLDRAARERDPALADELAAQVAAAGTDGADADAATDALDALCPCP
jgi:hypothetical protein